MSRLAGLRYLGQVTSFFAGILLITMSNPSYASAFALREQSITYLGNAYAGTASAAQDASTSYYNPAGMSSLAKSEIVLSAAYNWPHYKLYNATARNSIGSLITGNNPCTPKAQLLVPGFNAVLRATKNMSLGLSVVEPFGLDTEYAANDIARLMATTSKITTIDISPTISYKFRNKFFVGAGIDFLRTNATISSGVAWGNNAPEANGYVNNDMDDSWTVGYHVGLLYKPTKRTNIGLVYFSRFTPKFSGNTWSYQTLDFDNATNSTSALHLPDRINFGVTQEFTKKFTAMCEVEWTHWSRLKNWVMNYNSTALPGNVAFYYKNTWRVSLGADYKFLRAWTLKGGLAYDQSPTNNTYRSAMLPDSNRYMLGVGLKYTIHKYISILGAYSYAFFNDTSIAQRGALSSLNPSPNVSNDSSLYGQYKNYQQIFGLQLVFGFK